MCFDLIESKLANQLSLINFKNKQNSILSLRQVIKSVVTQMKNNFYGILIMTARWLPLLWTLILCYPITVKQIYRRPCSVAFDDRTSIAIKSASRSAKLM